MNCFFFIVVYLLSFQGRIENYPLSIESTFKYGISLKNLSVYPEDARFYFVKPEYLPQLNPGDKTHVSRHFVFVILSSILR